jgi:osomolarity two-component system, response regulator SSK1
MLDAGECLPDSLPPSRPKPRVQSFLLQRLLRHLNASLTSDLQPKTFSVGRTCELTVTLDRGSPSATVPPSIPPPDLSSASSPSSETRIVDEPTLEELMQFVETLKGKKAMLYASSKGSFAHHLTSYLTAWGLDVTIVSREVEVEGNSDSRAGASAAADSMIDRPPVKTLLSAYEAGGDAFPPSVTSSPKVGGQPQYPHTVSFVLIDDDVDVLRERLRAFHAEQPHPFGFNVRRQPLTAFHRSRPSLQSHRFIGQARSIDGSPSVVIVHFTSLTNFKLIKDIVHLVLMSYSGSSSLLPEVMIIPKPVGPRRFLTALHTAVTKPTVDPYFSPTATSPTHPGLHSGTLSNTSFQKSPTHRPFGSRTNSDRSVRSSKDVTGEYANLLPPSPLAISDGRDYFPDIAAKLGNTPSSGLVVQSPDGQPAGIFFHPRAKGLRNPPSASLMPHTRRAPSPSCRSNGEPKSALGNVTIPTVLAASTSSEPPSLAMEIQESQEDQSTLGTQSRELSSEDPGSSSSLHVPSSPLPGKSSPLENVTRNGTPSLGERAISPNAPERRVTPKRPSMDKAASLPPGIIKKGKGPADANVVPPISVLIVDGGYGF